MMKTSKFQELAGKFRVLGNNHHGHTAPKHTKRVKHTNPTKLLKFELWHSNSLQLFMYCLISCPEILKNCSAIGEQTDLSIFRMNSVRMAVLDSALKIDVGQCWKL